MASICFVAGDPSGDQHAAHLIDALRAKVPSLRVSGLGGPAMQRAGLTLLEDLTAASAIGPFDAAKHLGQFRRAAALLDAHLAATRPDLVVLVDFGDYNLPVIAPLVKRHRIPIAYYISPQLWAWGRFRLRYVRRYIDRMIVFFPFEERLYREAGVAVTWVGHPLIDLARPSLSREAALERFGLNPFRRTVGLLPGSRERELSRHLPLMLGAARWIARRMPGVQFLLPKAPGVSREQLDRALDGLDIDVRVSEGSVYDALQLMEVAAVASGTATLDAALAEVPMAVVYRASWPTYAAARLVIRVPDIGLVNIVAGRRIVPELVQHRATPSRLGNVLVELLRDEARCAEMRKNLKEVRAKLEPPARPGAHEERAGGAVDRAAEAVLDLLTTAASTS